MGAVLGAGTDDKDAYAGIVAAVAENNISVTIEKVDVPQLQRVTVFATEELGAVEALKSRWRKAGPARGLPLCGRGEKNRRGVKYCAYRLRISLVAAARQARPVTAGGCKNNLNKVGTL